MIFENFGKIADIVIFKKIIKIYYKQNIKCLVFFKSARRVCDLINFNSIKTAHKTLIFFQKLIFAF